MSQLTPAQRFIIWRRRNELTREECAQLFGVQPRLITAWERGRAAPPRVLLDEDNITQGQWLHLDRRSSSLTLRAYARSKGISHVTQLKKEL